MSLLASDFDRPPRLNAAAVPAPKKLRITSVAKENIGGESKAVLYFVGLSAGWILNTTNRRTIADSLGDDMLTWVGKVIIVYPDMVDFEGRLVPGLRCRVPKQKDPPAPVVASLSNGNGAAHHVDRGEYLDDEPDPDEFDNRIAYENENARLHGEEVDDDVAF
jgi:hypothetical protein